MYGMINQAIEELILEQHGKAAWQRIRTEAGLDDEAFVSMQSYPDDTTYRLVVSASHVLQAPPGAVLESFGESWTDYARRTTFARLMQFGGRTFPEFVASLDQMHAKIKFSLPELQPPSFRVTEQTDSSFRLHYYSRREGLAHLVVGMMRGVGKIYAVRVDIRLDRARGESQDHDEFVVTFAPDHDAAPAAAG